MKSVARIGFLTVLLAAVGTALAQPGGPGAGPRGGGPPGREQPSGDEMRPRPPRPPRREAGRFTIVTLGKGALLLDSSTGDTWSFVADDTPASGHWEPVIRRMPEPRDHRPSRDERESENGPPPPETGGGPGSAASSVVSDAGPPPISKRRNCSIWLGACRRKTSSIHRSPE